MLIYLQATPPRAALHCTPRPGLGPSSEGNSGVGCKRAAVPELTVPVQRAGPRTWEKGVDRPAGALADTDTAATGGTQGWRGEVRVPGLW